VKFLLASITIFLLVLAFPIVSLASSETALITITARGRVITQEKVLGATLANKGSDSNNEAGQENESQNEVENPDQVSDEVQEVEIERENGQINLKTKTATGSSQIKADDDKLLVNVEAAEKKNDLKIRKKGNKIELEQNGVKVETEFDLKVDTDANLVTVVSPNGEVQLKTLPAEMVNDLVKNKKIERANTIEIVADPANKGKIVYKIFGEKDVKFFGLLRTKFAVVDFVDVGTGRSTSEELPFVLRFFGFLFAS